MNFGPHLRQIFQLRGRPSTFSPAAGSDVSCRAIRQGGGEPVNIGPIRVVVDRTRFHVRRAEVAAPASGDVLTVDGDDYTVDAVQPVERDADQQLWCLETSWGTVLEYRAVTGSGSTQSPPTGSGYRIHANVAAGQSTITIAADLAVGRLVTGDRLTIAGDATVYTVAGPVTAASNRFTNVGISPALAAAAEAGDAVTFDFSGDHQVRAAVAAYAAQEILGGVQTGDRRIVILAAALAAAGMATNPKGGDRIVLDGRTFNVITASAIYGSGSPVAWDIQARG